MPFFSIIIASYNAEELIADTISSVLSQSFTDYEIIVKDACSSDNTLKMIPEHSSIKVYSEKDGGIYDGMNAGIKYASGEFLTFLNCGDSFYDDKVLESTYELIKASSNRGIVYGDLERDGSIFVHPASISAFTLYRFTLTHQTMFFHRSVFEKCGLYQTKYKIKADYDITLSAYFAGFQFNHIPHTICHYQGGGYSEKNADINAREYKEIVASHYKKSDLLKYRLILMLTLQKFRIFLTSSPKVPEFIKSAYRSLVNFANRK